jgi:hypothetical protein
MKKFKTRKEILINPEFKNLTFELLREELIIREGDSFFSKEEEIESILNKFIDRKLKQCKNQGI